MNKVVPLMVLCSAAIITTIVLSGCDNTASASTEKPHLSTFLSLHNQYCEKKYNDQETLTKTLEVSPELSLAKYFKGVYEVHKHGVSYAVSPEEDGCTTDVMIQNKDKSELFSFEDINKALISLGYVETGKPVSRKDIGTDQSELTIIEKKYVSPKGEITVLDYPLEKKDKYYMTLFAEKFTQAKQQNKEKIISTLTMAAL
ncbi:MAG: hypothetical protein ACI88H_000278 [Cocleimonas sp.]|jgi:hypothetical protein